MAYCEWCTRPDVDLINDEEEGYIHLLADGRTQPCLAKCNECGHDAHEGRECGVEPGDWPDADIGWRALPPCSCKGPKAVQA